MAGCIASSRPPSRQEIQRHQRPRDKTLLTRRSSRERSKLARVNLKSKSPSIVTSGGTLTRVHNRRLMLEFARWMGWAKPRLGRPTGHPGDRPGSARVRRARSGSTLGGDETHSRFSLGSATANPPHHHHSQNLGSQEFSRSSCAPRFLLIGESAASIPAQGSPKSSSSASQSLSSAKMRRGATPLPPQLQIAIKNCADLLL